MEDVEDVDNVRKVSRKRPKPDSDEDYDVGREEDSGGLSLSGEDCF